MLLFIIYSQIQFAYIVCKGFNSCFLTCWILCQWKVDTELRAAEVCLLNRSQCASGWVLGGQSSGEWRFPALTELSLLWRQLHKEIIKDGGKCADKDMCRESGMQRGSASSRWWGKWWARKAAEGDHWLSGQELARWRRKVGVEVGRMRGETFQGEGTAQEDTGEGSRYGRNLQAVWGVGV